MLPGTIAMLVFIVVVIFGGAIALVKKNLSMEDKRKTEVGEPTDTNQ